MYYTSKLGICPSLTGSNGTNRGHRIKTQVDIVIVELWREAEGNESNDSIYGGVYVHRNDSPPVAHWMAIIRRFAF